MFDEVGKDILTNAWKGFHCCLFAYGQTGSGKSYSMIGFGANRGIVPIICEEIFKTIEIRKKDEKKEFEVQFSMMEIYNERVQDLLIPIDDRPVSGLKIREHKKYGVFVAGLDKHPCDSYEMIQGFMEQGNENRTLASTRMNATSSRAHTIITIELKQIESI